MVALILDDLTGADLLRLNPPFCFQFILVWNLVSYLFLSSLVSLLFQKLMILKEEHHPSGLKIVLGGLQVFLV